jgi:phosphatidylglycerol lysyltransferase
MTPTILLATGIVIARRLPFVRRIPAIAGARLGALAPTFFALITFLAGAILLFSGATPARAGRVGWLNDFLPLPIIEASAYFASIAGIGLIVLARGLQRRLDAAYHLTLWLLAGGVVFAVTSALDVEQAIVLSIMLLMLLPNRRFFYRKASIFEERFTPGWIVAITVVLTGTVALVIAGYGRTGVGADVFWRFGGTAQGPRELRALTSAAIVLVSVASARLIRPARTRALLASADERVSAERVVAASTRASAQLAFLGDKSFMFSEDRSAFIMYGVSGQSWVSVGDPVGPNSAAVKQLIDEFITQCDRRGGWPVFYRVRPALLHLYLDYALAVVKLGEVARVSLPDFTLDGPKRRNLRRVWRKAVDDGCSFEIVAPGEIDALLPTLREISDAWLRNKRTREKGFSLGAFDEEFIRRSAIGLVRQRGTPIAFVTLWRSGGNAEVEVDLMRYAGDAPPGIMRYALIEAMFWARAQGYQQFNLGMAPLSGIRASSVTPIWNQISLAVRGMGERYYNFRGLREFKDWFYPEWEPSYLVSPGGTRRPLILGNISSLVSGSIGGAFRK